MADKRHNEITLRAGDNEKTYFEDDKPTGNMDDFNVRNVRLLLGDGTEIRDPQFSDPALIHDLGDDGRFLPFVTFQFDISPDKAKPYLTHGIPRRLQTATRLI